MAESAADIVRRLKGQSARLACPQSRPTTGLRAAFLPMEQITYCYHGADTGQPFGIVSLAASRSQTGKITKSIQS
jgi:hypothetical protein